MNVVEKSGLYMDFESKIHQEILQTLERRSKIDMTKSTFLTTLFGISAIGKIDLNTTGISNVTLFGAVYIAPFVALVCDCFILRELWSLRRMGEYLCMYGDPEERRYESYLKGKRNPFYKWGFIGLTVLTLIVAIWILVYQKGGIVHLNNNDYAWLGVSIVSCSVVDIWGWRLLTKTFDDKNKVCKNKKKSLGEYRLEDIYDT